MTPETCPVCGADVPAGAKSCPECGADERTGWDEEKTRYDGLDLPESAFDESSPSVKRSPARGPSFFWWLVGAITLVAIVYLALGGAF